MTPTENETSGLKHKTQRGHRVAITAKTGLLLVAAIGSFWWMAVAAPNDEHGETVMAAIFAASMVSSIAGFAFSAVAGGILFHLHDDPVHIVAIMVTCSIANQFAMTWAFRRDINWHILPPYFAGGALGLWIGIWILLHADRTLYTHLLGGFLLAYGGYMLLRRAIIIRRQPLIADIIAGFLGGITGGAAAFPGAFVSIWCSMRGWDKARQRAVIQPFILVMQVAGLLAIGLAHPARAGRAAISPHDLIFIPASLFGTRVGLSLYGRLTDLQFGRAVNFLLIVSGLTFLL
jgi:uncharacterized membrane protein YfcA